MRLPQSNKARPVEGEEPRRGYEVRMIGGRTRQARMTEAEARQTADNEDVSWVQEAEDVTCHECGSTVQQRGRRFEG